MTADPQDLAVVYAGPLNRIGRVVELQSPAQGMAACLHLARAAALGKLGVTDAHVQGVPAANCRGGQQAAPGRGPGRPGRQR